MYWGAIFYYLFIFSDNIQRILRGPSIICCYRETYKIYKIFHPTLCRVMGAGYGCVCGGNVPGGLRKNKPAKCVLSVEDVQTVLRTGLFECIAGKDVRQWAKMWALPEEKKAAASFDLVAEHGERTVAASSKTVRVATLLNLRSVKKKNVFYIKD